jgi:hypothetical protein
MPAVVHTCQPQFVVPHHIAGIIALAIVVLAVVVHPVVVVLPRREAQQAQQVDNVPYLPWLLLHLAPKPDAHGHALSQVQRDWPLLSAGWRHPFPPSSSHCHRHRRQRFPLLPKIGMALFFLRVFSPLQRRYSFLMPKDPP